MQSENMSKKYTLKTNFLLTCGVHLRAVYIHGLRWKEWENPEKKWWKRVSTFKTRGNYEKLECETFCN